MTCPRLDQVCVPTRRICCSGICCDRAFDAWLDEAAPAQASARTTGRHRSVHGVPPITCSSSSGVAAMCVAEDLARQPDRQFDVFSSRSTTS